MQKTILLTGATDGIGLEAAKSLYSEGHRLLLHGRSAQKLAVAERIVREQLGEGSVETYRADLSNLAEVEALASAVAEKHDQLDVLINNAGVFKTPAPITADGFDVRFVVNTIAPYLLTRRLLPLMGAGGRVINLSSAAQSPVDSRALLGELQLGDDFTAYAQSKLAITQWSAALARELGQGGPVVVVVNPGSLLATKMVKEGFGMAGHDIRIGADILVRAALSEEFASATGRYFDNDARCFVAPHQDALNDAKCSNIVRQVEGVMRSIGVDTARN